ncbi:hypothetical protein HYU06_05205 [Candidatus Woesearchaeota archaeon]|nr:hypothetical protein [Candidatus Woesearchaeota archaeon]
MEDPLEELLTRLDSDLTHNVPNLSADGVEELLRKANREVNELIPRDSSGNFKDIAKILAITNDGQLVVYRTSDRPSGRPGNYVAQLYGDMYEELVTTIFDCQKKVNETLVRQAENPFRYDSEGVPILLGVLDRAVKYTTDLLKELVELRKPYNKAPDTNRLEQFGVT